MMHWSLIIWESFKWWKKNSYHRFQTFRRVYRGILHPFQQFLTLLPIITHNKTIKIQLNTYKNISSCSLSTQKLIIYWQWVIRNYKEMMKPSKPMRRVWNLIPLIPSHNCIWLAIIINREKNHLQKKWYWNRFHICLISRSLWSGMIFWEWHFLMMEM